MANKYKVQQHYPSVIRDGADQLAHGAESDGDTAVQKLLGL